MLFRPVLQGKNAQRCLQELPLRNINLSRAQIHLSLEEGGFVRAGCTLPLQHYRR